MSSKSEVDNLVSKLFKCEYGRLVSVLTKAFGTANLDLAEDMVQEAMVEACKTWNNQEIPDNPVGWIYRVAKNKAINAVNKDQNKRKYNTEIALQLQSEWTVEPAFELLFTNKEIADDQLRMMFICCHPILSRDSQIALILKTLCAFTIEELARAFLTNVQNINKRLVRARKTIRDENIPFKMPQGAELRSRVSAILETIYLLFNEGYSSTSGEKNIRRDLCYKSIHLTTMLAEHSAIEPKSNIFALLSLMSFNASRFNARLVSNELIELEHQDWCLWDQPLISQGMVFLEQASKNLEVSKYHILATISGHYCTAKNFDEIDWENIALLYDQLIKIDNSPIVLLNRAVVISKLKGPLEALKEIEAIQGKKILESYIPYFTVRAELKLLCGNLKESSDLLKRAINLPMDDSSRNALIEKLKKIKVEY